MWSRPIGDEVLAVFPAADGAAQAAIEIQLRICKQRTNRDTPVAMHIGFHSGPTIEDEDDVFGDAVNVAARLTTFATGGQIFTSAQTAAELSPALRARTRDQDSHTVRGKDQDRRDVRTDLGGVRGGAYFHVASCCSLLRRRSS